MTENVVTIAYGDSAFSGVWRVSADVLHVESAYGLAWTPLGLSAADPELLAEKVMMDLAADWLAGEGQSLH